MRKNTLTIRMLFNVEGQVFNVGNESTKKRYDPIFGRSYGYASADNVKHNIRESYLELCNKTTDKTYFMKDVSNNEKDKQGAVYTEASIDNEYYWLFGLWNADDKFKKAKYAKSSLKSAINISDMLPIHPLLCKMDKQCGTRTGNSNDSVCFCKGDNVFYTPEELAKGVSLSIEEAVERFKNTRPANFYNKNETSSGLFYVDYVINLNDIKYVNISNFTLDDEDKKYFKDRGFKFTMLNNTERMKVPTDIAIEAFNYLVESLFDWDFSSNNATHGSIKERLRTTVALNNTSLWQQSTIAIVDENNKSASLQLFTREEEKWTNVDCYNSELLRKFYNKQEIDYDIFADENAMKKIKEIGSKVLTEI